MSKQRRNPRIIKAYCKACGMPMRAYRKSKEVCDRRCGAIWKQMKIDAADAEQKYQEFLEQKRADHD